MPVNTFPSIDEIEAKHGFTIEALEQFEYIITYLNEILSTYRLMDQYKQAAQ